MSSLLATPSAIWKLAVKRAEIGLAHLLHLIRPLAGQGGPRLADHLRQVDAVQGTVAQPEAHLALHPAAQRLLGES